MVLWFYSFVVLFPDVIVEYNYIIISVVAGAYHIVALSSVVTDEDEGHPLLVNLGYQSLLHKHIAPHQTLGQLLYSSKISDRS
jgi:hypothetical protein